MNVFIDLVCLIRSIRAEKKVEAGKKINAIVYAGRFTGSLKAKMEPLKKLARLNEVVVKSEGEKVKKAILASVHGIKLYLPIAELFDMENEAARLRKKIEETEMKLSTIKNKLENQSFIEKAPLEIVKKEKELFIDLQRELGILDKELNELKSLR